MQMSRLGLLSTLLYESVQQLLKQNPVSGIVCRLFLSAGSSSVLLAEVAKASSELSCIAPSIFWLRTTSYVSFS